MVLQGITTIARVVAAATPAVFAGLDKACTALEASAGLETAVSTSENERARGAIIAFRAACDTRKALTSKRRRRT